MHGKVNLAEKLASFDEPWVPKVVGELNDQYVKLVKFEDEYLWHHHQNEEALPSAWAVAIQWSCPQPDSIGSKELSRAHRRFLELFGTIRYSSRSA